MKPGIEVTGVWVRTAGNSAAGSKSERRLEVLVEIGGVFRLVQSHPEWSITDGEVSYITEPAGMERAPSDRLGRSRSVAKPKRRGGSR